MQTSSIVARATAQPLRVPFSYYFVDLFRITAILIAAVANWDQEFFQRFVEALLHHDYRLLCPCDRAFQFLYCRSTGIEDIMVKVGEDRIPSDVAEVGQ